MKDRIEIIVFGAHGSGAIVAMTAQRASVAGASWSVKGFLDDVIPAGTVIEDTPVLGTFSDWPQVSGVPNFIAPLHRYDVMRDRAQCICDLEIPPERWSPALIDPMAAVSGSAEIGEASYVAAGAVVLPGARIGRHAAVRSGSTISHDAVLHDFVFVGPNAVVSGSTVVGEGAFIGPGAVITSDISIGPYAIVGMGSVVTRSVPEGARVMPRERWARPGSPEDV